MGLVTKTCFGGCGGPVEVRRECQNMSRTRHFTGDGKPLNSSHGVYHEMLICARGYFPVDGAATSRSMRSRQSFK